MPDPNQAPDSPDQRWVDGVDRRLNDHARRLRDLELEIVKVPLMTAAFNRLSVVLTGAIIAVVGTAAGIILTGGSHP